MFLPNFWINRGLDPRKWTPPYSIWFLEHARKFPYVPQPLRLRLQSCFQENITKYAEERLRNVREFTSMFEKSNTIWRRSFSWIEVITRFLNNSFKRKRKGVVTLGSHFWPTFWPQKWPQKWHIWHTPYMGFSMRGQNHTFLWST